MQAGENLWDILLNRFSSIGFIRVLGWARELSAGSPPPGSMGLHRPGLCTSPRRRDHLPGLRPSFVMYTMTSTREEIR